ATLPRLRSRGRDSSPAPNLDLQTSTKVCTSLKRTRGSFFYSSKGHGMIELTGSATQCIAEWLGPNGATTESIGPTLQHFYYLGVAHCDTCNAVGLVQPNACNDFL